MFWEWQPWRVLRVARIQLDAAIRSASAQKPVLDLPKLTTFLPFDPSKKTSEATATDAKGGALRIIKGAFTAVAKLVLPSPTSAEIANDLEKQGFRVLAVAAGTPGSLQLMGFIALSDPLSDGFGITYFRTEGVGRACRHGHRAMRQPQPPLLPTRWDWRERSVRRAR